MRFYRQNPGFIYIFVTFFLYEFLLVSDRNKRVCTEWTSNRTFLSAATNDVPLHVPFWPSWWTFGMELTDRFPLFFALMCNALLRVRPFPSLCGVVDVRFAVFLHPFTFLNFDILTFLGSEPANAELAPQSAVEDTRLAPFPSLFSCIFSFKVGQNASDRIFKFQAHAWQPSFSVKSHFSLFSLFFDHPFHT